MNDATLQREVADYLGVKEKTAGLYLQILSMPRCFTELNSSIHDLDSQLTHLIELRLVSEYIDERNDAARIVFATDPSNAFSALLLNEAWGSDSSFHTLDDIERASGFSELKSKYQTLHKLIPELKAIYSKQLPYISELVVVVKGKNKIAAAIADLIGESENNVIAIASPPQLMGEMVWRAIEDRMSCDVMYERVTDFDEIVRHGFAIVSREAMSDTELLYVFKEGALQEKFYIIDNEQVAFFEKDKRRRNFINKIQIFKNAEVAEKFRQRFDSIKEKSVDVREILPLISEYRSILLTRWRESCDSDVADWLLDLFDNGVFYTQSNYSDEFIYSSVNECINLGLIIQLSDGNVVINYSLADIIASKKML